ncbi:uncharacterized protein N0V89_007592 [Didymosphaeria variabile]|uniref:Uncharacterized protein n=1 Tax=Didymosphaeria variabile TaxID=1932322 RepID=A0A9W8XJ50_9PLEO|nr:uncharacterized protein N0V89_007592 [Didymosphaeria variabile]KAJ4352245.1 hypothetical protein N0V89_007592 [Didymosphaeria variabile]
MRRGVLLHKLFLALWRGFWLFPPYPIYSWWLSVGGMLLDASWSIHNVIAWMKVAPFLPHRTSQAFIWTLILAQPFWIMEIYANFAYFHGWNDLFLKTRPWEALCRDPWWIISSSVLFWKIKMQYDMRLKEIVVISPRFGIMMLAAILSVIFFILDIISATNTLDLGLPSGINPFWKVSSVFKCLMDCVVLDDFKTAMDRLRAYKISHLGSFAQDTNSTRIDYAGDLVRTWEEVAADAQRRSEAISFGGGALVGNNHPTEAEPGRGTLEHRYPSQVHTIVPSSPDSEPSSFGNGTFSEIFYHEDMNLDPLEDDPTQRPKPAHVN